MTFRAVITDDRAKKLALYAREVATWTDEELVDELTNAHAPTVIPPCCVCGGKLSVGSIGGGRPTIYACAAVEDDPERPGLCRRKAGREYGRTQEERDEENKHYDASRFEDVRHTNERVRELLRRFSAPGTCRVYATPCHEHGFIHGAEAEELRAGIEKLIDPLYDLSNRDLRDDLSVELRRLLNKVDARDSLAYRWAAKRCVRCGAPFSSEGACSRRAQGCQGGRGEV